MATCPECGANSRDVPPAMALTRIMVAKPLGTYSISGTTPKVSMVDALELTCACGWHIYGDIGPDGAFWAWPSSSQPKDDDVTWVAWARRSSDPIRWAAETLATGIDHDGTQCEGDGFGTEPPESDTGS